MITANAKKSRSERRVTELDDDRYVVLVDGVRYVYEPEFSSVANAQEGVEGVSGDVENEKEEAGMDGEMDEEKTE